MSWREPILNWKSTQMTMKEIVSFVESKKAEHPDCEVIFDGDSGCILLEHPGLEGY